MISITRIMMAVVVCSVVLVGTSVGGTVNYTRQVSFTSLGNGSGSENPSYPGYDQDSASVTFYDSDFGGDVDYITWGAVTRTGGSAYIVKVVVNGSTVWTRSSGYYTQASWSTDVSVSGSSFSVTVYVVQDNANNQNAYFNVDLQAVTDTTPPSVPSLSSPANGADLTDSTPTFSWSASSGSPTQYQILVDNNSNFSSPEVSATPASTSYTSGSLSDGTYYWKVRASDAGGNWSSYSSVRNFSLDATGPAIGTLTPADNAGAVPTNSNLVIAFDENVTAVSGNITIYRAGGAQVEQIDVTGAQVSGSGGSTITIDPSVYFDEKQAYYVEVDATAFDDLLGNGFAGISGNSAWNFTATNIMQNQTISFPDIPDQHDTNVVCLAATASSGLNVSFSVGSGPASISDDTNLTFTGEGTVSIVASQAGNIDWNPAPPVTNTFEVAESLFVNTTLGTSVFRTGSGDPITVDSGIVIHGTFSGSLDANVEISSGFQAGDVLAGGGGSYDSDRGLLTISGASDIADLQSKLRQVTFDTTSGDASDRVITVTVGEGLGSESLLFNGHYYEFVTSSGIDWDDAEIAAAGMTHAGLDGYLATVTSQEENDFIADKLSGQGWMGASDADSEGVWKWVTGPEAGTQFWQGAQDGSSVGGMYDNWVPGGEPNNAVGGEHYGHFYEDGSWNDYAIDNNSIEGYVVEYGGIGFGGEAGDSGVSDTKTVEITVNGPSASFTYSPAEIWPNYNVTFTDTSSDNGSITNWTWDFGDGHASSSQNPSHRFDSVGSYTVELTVYDNDGGSHSAIRVLQVSDPDFSVVRSRQAGNGITLDLETSNGRTYRVYARDNSVTGTPTLLTTSNAFAETMEIDDTNVIGQVDARFYEVVEDDGESLTTNPVLYAAYVTPTTTGRWYRLSMPINLGGSNSLDSTLGEQLRSGIAGDALSGDLLYALGTNGAWNTYVLNESGEWRTYPADGPASDRLGQCQSFWIKRRSSGSVSNAVYTGPVYLEADPVRFYSNRWHMIAWPFPTPRREDAGTDKGWGFATAGARTGSSWTTADNFWVDGTLLWLHSDGRWRKTTGATAEDVELEALKGYYYLHRGDGFTWTPENE